LKKETKPGQASRRQATSASAKALKKIASRKSLLTTGRRELLVKSGKEREATEEKAIQNPQERHRKTEKAALAAGVDRKSQGIREQAAKKISG